MTNEVGGYFQVATYGFAFGYDGADGVTVTGFAQSSMGVAGAVGKSFNLNLDFWNPITVEDVSLYLGVAVPTGTPILASSALINTQTNDTYVSLGIGVADVVEVGFYWEGAGGGLMSGVGTVTVMGDATGFFVDDYCFAASTSIQTSLTETKPISAVGVGDTVLAYDRTENFGRGALVPRKVVRLYRNVTDEWVRLSWMEGAEAKEIVVTPGHHFLDHSGNFTPISDMVKEGRATVVLASGELTEAAAERIKYSLETAHLFERAEMHAAAIGNAALKSVVDDVWQTYNFEVEELHTYVAGGVRVHNMSGTIINTGGQIGQYRWDHGDGSIDRLYETLVPAGSGRDGVGSFVSSAGGYYSAYTSGQFVGETYQPGGDYDGDGRLETSDRSLHNADLYDRMADEAREEGNTAAAGQYEDRADRYRDEAASTTNVTPVILDLDGDGVEAEMNTGATFDFDGDGYRETGAWVGSDDGFLVVDLDVNGGRGAGDGEINLTQELVLSLLTDNPNDTDLQALRNSYLNNNRSTVTIQLENGTSRQVDVLNASDTGWSSLRVWQDFNQDGDVDSGELKTLAQLGITQINLGYDNGRGFTDILDDVVIGDIALHGLASFVRNGETIVGGVGDFNLGYEDLGWRRVDVKNTSGIIIGYEYQFESGERLRYANIAGLTEKDLDLTENVLDGASGDARANVLAASGFSRAVKIAGGAGNDTISGGGNDDLLSGDSGADRLGSGLIAKTSRLPPVHRLT